MLVQQYLVLIKVGTKLYTGDEHIGLITRVMAKVIDPALATAGKPCDLGQDLA